MRRLKAGDVSREDNWAPESALETSPPPSSVLLPSILLVARADRERSKNEAREQGPNQGLEQTGEASLQR